jgi:acyl-coenzyme A synthetase/AMP-(fatty) acid ligase
MAATACLTLAVSRVVVTDRFPKTASGKVQRHLLNDEAHRRGGSTTQTRGFRSVYLL